MKNSNGPHKKAQRLTAMVLYAALSLFVIQAAAQQSAHNPSPDMTAQHQNMMMNMGPGMMGMGDDSQTMAEMGAIHELIVNHDRIKRSVTNLPEGIRTVTESDDPQIAKLIKEHVASMDQRVSAKSDPGLPIESPALHSILKNGDKVQTTIETTEQGVVVIQTSKDPETVAALQQHASEVSDLVQSGMTALHAAMMKNGMHGGMMGNLPKSETPDQSAVTPQVHDQTSMAHSHDQHHAAVNQRGDQVMGFDHAKTKHHFLLRPDGGVIQVEATDPKDTASRDEIRQHLRHIAQLFANGDFTAPMLIHAQTPPGVPVMKRLKANIKYRFEETERGGRVRITTTNPDALAAVHEFLRFQISDHATGDSGKVEKP
jgi:hypothetical protein